ncbi:MAG: hypothetical protein Q8R24_03545 [Legionellaceae bacterium]|nr:hypothetical protein [Legionellaceae bacterium]
MNEIRYLVPEPEIFRKRVELDTHVKETQTRTDLALERAVGQIWTEEMVLSPDDFAKIKNEYDKILDMKALDDKRQLLETTKGLCSCYTHHFNEPTLYGNIKNLRSRESTKNSKGYIFLRERNTGGYTYWAVIYGFDYKSDQLMIRQIKPDPNPMQKEVLEKFSWPKVGYLPQSLSEQDEHLISTLLLPLFPAMAMAIKVNHIFWKNETAARFSCYLSKHVRMNYIVVEKNWFLEAITMIANAFDPRAYCSTYYQTRGLDSTTGQEGIRIYELIYGLTLAFIKENIYEVSQNARDSVEYGAIL